jgi:hypothetical protein
MTTTTDLKAVTLTASAKAAAIKQGADVSGLMLHARVKAEELRVLIAQIIALHPNGDANLTALNNILNALL